tara:strand:- start:39297 stop:40112 length:816 start_codon:yes stop_codon:yes gene_type:complete
MLMSPKVLFPVFPKLAAVAALTLVLSACNDSAEEAGKQPDSKNTTSMTDQTDVANAASEDVKTDAGMTASVDREAITSATKAVDLPKSDGDVDMAEVLKPGPMEEMFLGDADAPVKIVEYMSMTCPHCANFHNNTFKQIIKDYADTGKVQFIVREFPFDPRATGAIMLARCAPNDRFFPMVEVLMQQQSNWARAEDARTALFDISKLAGFTQESFEACLTNQKLVDDVNAVRTKGAEEFGVSSTPTFLINGKRYSGNMSVEQMSALIDSLL